MAWTYKVSNAVRDAQNFNITVDIEYTDGVSTYMDRNWPLGIVPEDEVAARIDEQARKRIRNVFEPGDLALAQATIVADGKPRPLPPDPVVDTKEQEVKAATVELQNALAAKNLTTLKGDPDPAVAAAATNLEAVINS